MNKEEKMLKQLQDLYNTSALQGAANMVGSPVLWGGQAIESILNIPPAGRVERSEAEELLRDKEKVNVYCGECRYFYTNQFEDRCKHEDTLIVRRTYKEKIINLPQCRDLNVNNDCPRWDSKVGVAVPSNNKEEIKLPWYKRWRKK